MKKRFVEITHKNSDVNLLKKDCLYRFRIFLFNLGHSLLKYNSMSFFKYGIILAITTLQFLYFVLQDIVNIDLTIVRGNMGK